MAILFPPIPQLYTSGHTDVESPSGSVVKSPLATRFAGEVRSNVEPPVIAFKPVTSGEDVPPPGQAETA